METKTKDVLSDQVLAPLMKAYLTKIEVLNCYYRDLKLYPGNRILKGTAKRLLNRSIEGYKFIVDLYEEAGLRLDVETYISEIKERMDPIDIFLFKHKLFHYYN